MPSSGGKSPRNTRSRRDDVGRDRVLVIDANLPTSLAGSVKKRGREAVSAAELGLAHNVKDPELLQALADQYADKAEWILVTGDDMMPAEHGQVIIETRATVATIFPEYPDGVTEHAWNVDVVQRWAHAMQEQQVGSVRRYSMGSSKPWRPRRRHIRAIAKDGLNPWRPGDAERAHATGPSDSSLVRAPRLPGFR
jgi:hypothetical protein